MSSRRSTRMVGLHPRARYMLYEANGLVDPAPLPTGDFYLGAHDEPLPLHRYETEQGKFTEYVQAAPWLGGPVVFTALVDDQGVPVEQSLWAEAEMDQNILSS